MEYLIRIVIFITVISKFIIQGNASAIEVIFILFVAAVNIFKHKARVTWTVLIIEALLITVGCNISNNFSLLYALIAYDAGIKNMKFFPFIVAVPAIYYSGLKNIEILTMIVMAFMYGYIKLKFSENINSFKATYDNERRYRYELEATKQRLLNSAKEVTYIAEIKERNRIAREIHDTVGHSIAGILLQLQVVHKLKNKDEEKSDKLLLDSIERLSETLNVMRNTVHNIRASNSVGLEYIEGIINNFKYCTVNFEHSGDFKSLPPNVLETISSDIKEALTNAYKYSKATIIDIKIDIREGRVRVYIKDNGEGCTNLNEGFGLMGIRERIKNLGGTVSFSGENGFMIVYIIPLEKEKGEELHEDNNC